MSDFPKILKPDDHGHYSRAAHELDRASHRQIAEGGHPMDGLAREMAVEATQAGLPGLPHFPPKAKRCIYLHLVGAPPQMETYDYKPVMKDWYDKDLPDSIRKGQRLTTMTSGQSRFPIAPSVFKFAQHGKSGAWVSELLPYTARMVDESMKSIG